LLALVHSLSRFFFNVTSPPAACTLSLHDALPILTGEIPAAATATDVVLTITEMLREHGAVGKFVEFYGEGVSQVPLANRAVLAEDRKSTRLNSSHVSISYAVFCLKKKNKTKLKLR